MWCQPGRGSPSSVSLGRLRTRPRAPSSLCSSTRITVRSKFSSPMAGLATRRRPLRDTRVGLPARTGLQQLCQLVGGEGRGEVEALGERASDDPNGTQLLLGLDAFGDYT